MGGGEGSGGGGADDGGTVRVKGWGGVEIGSGRVSDGVSSASEGRGLGVGRAWVERGGVRGLVCRTVGRDHDDDRLVFGLSPASKVECVLDRRT